MTDQSTQSCKRAAVEFLELVVAGRIEEAYQQFVNMEGRHHNPYFAAGFPALKTAMIENHIQMPDKRISVKHVLGDGDMVAVHSHLVTRPGDAGIAVVHLFRFHDRKIVEMWDRIQLLSTDTPNSDGAF